jgi:iron complex transport system substrate-binding protein
MITKVNTNIKLLIVLVSITTLLAQDRCNNKDIVSQSPYITDTLHYLDMDECIVGVTIYDLNTPDTIIRTGDIFSPDKEAIKKLEPDFLFCSDWTTPNTMIDITPKGTKSFILHGFQSMLQIENNLYSIGHVLGLKNLDQTVKTFSKKWKSLAEKIDAKNKKILLLRACDTDPYSFGEQTWLGDLFTKIGFELVETSQKVRAIGKNKEYSSLNRLIKAFQPDLIFQFVPDISEESCPLLGLEQDILIIHLNANYFSHPSPIIIEGLKELKSKQKMW